MQGGNEGHRPNPSEGNVVAEIALVARARVVPCGEVDLDPLGRGTSR